MDYVSYGVILLIIIAIIDCYNGWKLGSKITGKTDDQINEELKDSVANLDQTITNVKDNLDNFK